MFCPCNWSFSSLWRTENTRQVTCFHSAHTRLIKNLYTLFRVWLRRIGQSPATKQEVQLIQCKICAHILNVTSLVYDEWSVDKQTRMIHQTVTHIQFCIFISSSPLCLLNVINESIFTFDFHFVMWPRVTVHGLLFRDANISRLLWLHQQRRHLGVTSTGPAPSPCVWGPGGSSQHVQNLKSTWKRLIWGPVPASIHILQGGISISFQCAHLLMIFFHQWWSFLGTGLAGGLPCFSSFNNSLVTCPQEMSLFLIYIPNGPLKGYVYQMAGARDTLAF